MQFSSIVSDSEIIDNTSKELSNSSIPQPSNGSAKLNIIRRQPVRIPSDQTSNSTESEK
jgi:hypothetical protein